MNRICLTIAFIILCMWLCQNKQFHLSKPLSISGGAHGSYKVEADYDLTVKDLEDRILLSEAQIKALKGLAVKGRQSLHIMSESEPIHYKAANPPE